MISDWGLIPSSKYRTNRLAATTTSSDRSGDDFVSNINTASLPVPASDVAFCSDPCPLNLPESTVLDCADVDDATSNDYHNSIDENDIVIAVMGPTGVGRSSFVNQAAGRKVPVTNYGLRSETQAVQSIRCSHPDGRRNVVLVDTPGFDDAHLSDTQILKIIANWLKDTYQKNIKLVGLLYLHRISDVRLAGTPLRNLAVFQDMCGDENLKNVVLVTTMWDEVEDQSIGSKREEELLSGLWKGKIGFGSRTRRYEGTRESAWEIIDLLDLEGSRQKRTPLQIQREMVDRKLPLHETAAAKTLLRHLVQLAGEFKKAWAKMRNGVRRKPGPKNPPGGLRRNVIVSRSPTIWSSQPSWSVVSSADTASIAPRHSRSPSGSTESAFSGCSPTGHTDALLATITGLRIVHQVADMASIPILRGSIGTVLHIAQAIQEMGGTHHAIIRVVENFGLLLERITQHAAESQLSRDMKKALRSFQRELVDLQKVAMKIKERGLIARFFLHDADIQVIMACTTSIKEIYDKLEVKLAMDNSQAIAHLKDQLTALHNSAALWQCECHRMQAVHEESQETDGTP